MYAAAVPHMPTVRSVISNMVESLIYAAGHHLTLSTPYPFLSVPDRTSVPEMNKSSGAD